jgi:hypothetical protein
MQGRYQVRRNQYDGKNGHVLKAVCVANQTFRISDCTCKLPQQHRHYHEHLQALALDMYQSEYPIFFPLGSKRTRPRPRKYTTQHFLSSYIVHNIPNKRRFARLHLLVRGQVVHPLFRELHDHELRL